MIQDEFLENNIEEKDTGREKARKILAIIIFLLLASGIYYYTQNSPKTITANNTRPKVETPEVIAPEKQIEQNTWTRSTVIDKTAKIIVDKPTTPATIDKKKPSETRITQKDIEKAYIINPGEPIKPSDKSSLMKRALLAAGKPDPFYNPTPISVAQSNISGISSIRSYPRQNTIPPVPYMASQLPVLGNVPVPGLSTDLSSFNTFNPNDFVNVKGFWGDKVIVDINGITESLRVNESFQGVKVVSVDPKNMAARFKKSGRIIVKNLKNLSELENKGDIKLVKDLNK